MLQPTSPSRSHFYICPSSPAHPLTPGFLLLLSPSLPPCPLSISFLHPPIFLTFSLSLSPLCLRLPLCPSNAPAFHARQRLTRHDDRLIHPLFFFSPTLPHPTGERIEARYINAAITACLSTGGGDDVFPSLSS